MRAKCTGELFEGIYRIGPLVVEPSHRHGFQTRWEYLEHQGFIFRVDSHSLIEMAHMFNRVCSTVVDGECWLMEPPRKYCPFNLAREGQLGNLVQYFAHSVIFQASTSRALVPMFMVVFLFIQERLTRRSPRFMMIATILLTIRRGVRLRGSLSSSCMA